jgi:Na+/proline symporter
MASSFCLVSLFVPFTAALFIPGTSRSAVNWGMLSGLLVWFVITWIPTDVPSSIWGIAASILGMMMGQFIFKSKHA